MKKIISILFILLFTANYTQVFSQKRKKDYFKEIKTFSEKTNYKWYVGNKEIAKLFAKTYNKNHKKKDFKKQLYIFLNKDFDKYYQIASYVNSNGYYNDLKESSLEMELLQKGLQIAKDSKQENETIRYYYRIGKILFHSGKLDECKEYLIKGYKLSKKYPGNVPTFDSEKEYNEIMDFINNNL